MLVCSAARHADTTALVWDRRVSYASWSRAPRRSRPRCTRSVSIPATASCCSLPNDIALFEVLFALFRLGALPIMALPPHRQFEIESFCRQADAVAYVIADRAGGFDYRGLARKVRAGVPSLRHVIVAGEAEEFTQLSSLDAPARDFQKRDPADVGLFQLSGGSTGVPKLIPRTHDDYVCSLHSGVAATRLTASDVYLVALPALHNFPLSSPGALGTLLVGGTVVLARSGTPDDTFALIAREA